MTDEMIGLLLIIGLTWFVFYRSKIPVLRLFAGIVIMIMGWYSLLIVSSAIAVMIVVVGGIMVLVEVYEFLMNVIY